MNQMAIQALKMVNCQPIRRLFLCVPLKGSILPPYVALGAF